MTTRVATKLPLIVFYPVVLMEPVKIITGDGTELPGFLFEPSVKSQKAIIFIHGWKDEILTNSFVRTIAEKAATSGIAALAFNNRGAGRLGAVEKFEDCILDIGAAIRLMAGRGYERIYLASHSTGCQKAAYYIHKGNNVSGVAFIEPTDDIALARKELGGRYEKAIEVAKELVDSGKGNEMMPDWSLVGGRASAERYLSMFSNERTEGRIFDFSGKLEIISQIKDYTLCIYGSKSQYSDDPGGKLERLMYKMENSSAYLEEGAEHEFVGFEEKLAELIISWIREKDIA